MAWLFTMVLLQIPVSSGVTALTRSSRLLCVGHADGKVTMRDPRSYRIEHTFPAHTSGVADMDIRSDLLVTCGFGNRMGQVFVDPLVKVYDIRMNRVLIPLSFPAGPIFVRFHHKFSSSMVVVSQNNVFEMADVQSGVTGLQRTHVRVYLFMRQYQV
jgi:PAB-dependent poly(A)-specific ribonuclease subunit 2